MTKKKFAKKTARISALGEAGLIRRFRTKCTYSSREIIKGIGDDAAAIRRRGGTMLITSDMLLEGVHFDLSFTSFYQLGYKALAVNISDIFAMGGIPKYFLLNLGIPKYYKTEYINELYSGVLKIAGKFGISVVGGDTCESTSGLVLSGTLIGNADKIIARSGARPGDGIFVSSTLGDSAMGLLLSRELGKKIYFERQVMKDKGRRINVKGCSLKLTDSLLSLIRKHLMPEPAPLKKTPGITSMIDLSDGLLMDLSHICDESKVGAVVYRDKLPVSRDLAGAARDLAVDVVEFALRGGEDYTLLFTAAPGIKTKAVNIGEIIKKGRFLVDEKGRKSPFKAEGYEHFKNKNF